MGWFDEQIRQRKQNDDTVFSEAVYEIAGAVTGKKFFFSASDGQKRTKDAIDEILKYYNVKGRELPDKTTDLDAQLEYLLRPYGIMRRAVKLGGSWYKNAFGPMLARLTDGSIAALIPGRCSGYSFWDADTGRRVRVTRRNKARFSGEAICFYKPFPLTTLSEKEVFGFILKTVSKADAAGFGLLALLTTLIGMLLPAGINILFSHVAVQGRWEPLLAITVFLISVSLSTAVMTAAKEFTAAKIKCKTKLWVEAAVMMRILSLPSAFFKKHSAGSLASRAQSAGALCEILIDAALSAGLTTLLSLLYLVQIFAFAKALVLPALAAILTSALFSAGIAVLQIKVRRRELESTARVEGMGYALISGMQKIKLSGAEKRAFARWGKAYAERAAISYNPPFLIKISEAALGSIPIFAGVLIYFVAAKSGISMAEYYAFSSAYGIVSGAFMGLGGIAAAVSGVRATLESIQPIFAEAPEITPEKQVVSRLSGGIELNHVSFRYTEDGPNVVDDLSLKIRPGQYVAIVGTTGCGKSTLMKLMLGFEKPRKGAVYFDGHDLAKLDLKSLRRKIGVVLQEGKLFQGDIFSNISIAAPGLTLGGAWEAAEMAGVAEDIRNMPMGMHTIISEGSGGISGGQRQRILIARAIAARPKILMFDEATSALDNITQKIVSDSLESLKCTRIVIAHRLSTIRACDRIIVLDKGRIAEDGNYEALMEKNGIFAKLVERQQIPLKIATL